MSRLAFLLFLLALPAAGRADDLLHVTVPVVACSDLRSSRALESGAAGSHRSAHCFTVLPAQRWERIAGRDGMLLLRRVPAATGEPPLFFRPADVSRSAAMPAAAPARTTAGSPDDGGSGFRPGPLPVIALIVMVAAAALAGRRLTARWAIRRRRARAIGIATGEIMSQQRRLQIKKLQLVGADDYGTVDLGKWRQEKQYFCRTRILALLAAAGLDDQWPLIRDETGDRLEQAASQPFEAGPAPERFASDPRVFDPRMDPIDYERHCAMLLRASGWDTQLTVASGDQGTDVLARRKGSVLVVQCKLYRNSVGNAAVQQVSAARLHQRANFAAVCRTRNSPRPRVSSRGPTACIYCTTRSCAAFSRAERRRATRSARSARTSAGRPGRAGTRTRNGSCARR